jgi:hypothetical protein
MGLGISVPRINMELSQHESRANPETRQDRQGRAIATPKLKHMNKRKHSATSFVLANINFEFWAQRRQKFELDVRLTGSEDIIPHRGVTCRFEKYPSVPVPTQRPMPPATGLPLASASASSSLP